jgi:hypothetical protein
VVLTRGGGQGVQELDTDELIGAVAGAAVPVAVALEHATDDLVLNRVADVSFSTPTALGPWLCSVAEEKRDRARQVAEAEAGERAGGLVEQLGRLQKLQAALVRWQAVAAVLGLLLVGDAHRRTHLEGRVATPGPRFAPLAHREGRCTTTSDQRPITPSRRLTPC